MINLQTNKEYTLKDGDIIKKDLTSRQSWTMNVIDGKLMAVPNTNKFFKDATPIEWSGEDCFVIASISSVDYSKYTNNWNMEFIDGLAERCSKFDTTLKAYDMNILMKFYPEKVKEYFDHFKSVEENG
jgi:hypothetical protein